MNNKFTENINVDNLFPSDDNISGTRGRKLDIDTIFSCVMLNDEPNITFTTDVLLNKIKKRREKKLLSYRNMLKYCYQRIESADDDYLTDIMFKIVDSVPECKEYNSNECLEYISDKLRSQNIDTIIIDNNTMFITWKYLELKYEDKKETK